MEFVYVSDNKLAPIAQTGHGAVFETLTGVFWGIVIAAITVEMLRNGMVVKRSLRSQLQV